jgi:hypothetical protein
VRQAGLGIVEVGFGETVDLQGHVVVLVSFADPLHADTERGCDAAFVAGADDSEQLADTAFKCLMGNRLTCLRAVSAAPRCQSDLPADLEIVARGVVEEIETDPAAEGYMQINNRYGRPFSDEPPDDAPDRVTIVVRPTGSRKYPKLELWEKLKS